MSATRHGRVVVARRVQRIAAGAPTQNAATLTPASLSAPPMCLVRLKLSAADSAHLDHGVNQMVLSAMRDRVQHLEVLKSVVGLVAVDVMHVLVGAKLAS